MKVLIQVSSKIQIWMNLNVAEKEETQKTINMVCLPLILMMSQQLNLEIYQLISMDR